MNNFKSNRNIKLMKQVLLTYKLRKKLKKKFGLTLDNYLVLAYIDEYKNNVGRYYMRDIISYIGIDQSRVVKSVKELVKKDYLNKGRDPQDTRNVILIVSSAQHDFIENILKYINENKIDLDDGI
ncbi:transcriptional regulator, SarA/Rot family [Staphylococcus aureus]|uniref:transcriptional regulator, SarA/Rot family n=1 Tax=Staphylococcus aureus TaxID=1280 RepID=UPI00215BF847|nr:MarR family transcriptional regulator [Staphylococcus aureus]UVI82163.1 winged helix DNA-binding protein [Staphylococcus aureus]